ncbi:hypothetical protein [Haloarchaeobius sp. HRN-SO-5]|uniref:hypothetical protein n=1 Tax=Haloarchaeobius sp. HRN-SO-5 TaxID=3446118 RepID=UPI003EBDE2C5
MMSPIRGPVNRSLLVAGVTFVVVSIAAAAWLFSLGDVVTALGMGLLVLAGLLLTGIGLSPETTKR